MEWLSELKWYEIYAIGYLVAYVLMKMADVFDTDSTNEWRDVFVRLTLSLLSWLLILIAIVLLIIDFLRSIRWPKPPKWL